MQSIRLGVNDSRDLLIQMDQALEQELLRIQQRLPVLRKLCLRGAATTDELLTMVEAHDCLEAADGLGPALADLLQRIRQSLKHLKQTNPALIDSLKVYSSALAEETNQGWT